MILFLRKKMEEKSNKMLFIYAMSMHMICVHMYE